VSDDIVGIVNTSIQTIYLVLTTLKIHEWPECVTYIYICAISFHQSQ
jgi:hypothetical protein